MDVEKPHLDTPTAIILAGLFGSLLSLRFIDNMGLRQRSMAILAGMGMAHYLAPLIAHIFSQDNFEETIGFLVGLFGMSITAAIFRAIVKDILQQTVPVAGNIAANKLFPAKEHNQE